jgi:hypothetical protein
MRIIVMDFGEERVKTDGCKFLLHAFWFFVGFHRSNMVPNNMSVFKLRSMVKYIMYSRPITVAARSKA